jgi:hypothetical protein
MKSLTVGIPNLFKNTETIKIQTLIRASNYIQLVALIRQLLILQLLKMLNKYNLNPEVVKKGCFYDYFINIVNSFI